jgi:hypothetical protein
MNGQPYTLQITVTSDTVVHFETVSPLSQHDCGTAFPMHPEDQLLYNQQKKNEDHAQPSSAQAAGEWEQD